MAAKSEISAGKAFVDLYVRDFRFRRQMAENEKVFQESFSQPSTIEPVTIEDSSYAYQELGSIADDALYLIYEGTVTVAEETERLADALAEVMDTYLNLSDMGQEGITLSAQPRTGSGGTLDGRVVGRGIAAPEAGPSASTALTVAAAGAGTAVVASRGKGLGSASTATAQTLMTKLIPATADVSDSFVQLAVAIDEVMGKLYNLATGQKEIEGQRASIFRRLSESALKSAGSSAAGRAGTAAFSSDIVQRNIARIPGIGGLITSGQRNLTGGRSGRGEEGGSGATQSQSGSTAGVEVTTLATAATNAAAALATLAQSATNAAAAQGGADSPVMAQLANDEQPVMAELAGGGKASEVVTAELAGSAKESAAAVGMLSKALSVANAVFIKFLPILLAITAALAAAFVAFKALKLGVAIIKAPFQLAGKAISGMVNIIKSLPGLITGAIRKLKDFAVAAVEAVKSMGSKAWGAAVASVERVKAAMQSTGKTVAIIGGAMAAAGGAITAALTKAAEKFTEQGSQIKNLTLAYKRYGMTAEQASVYAYAASQASGLLGQMGEAERINNITRQLKVGTPEYEKWRKEAEAAGAVMGGNAVAGASALSAAYRQLSAATNGLWVQLGSAVAPAIEDFTKLTVGALKGVIKWVQANKPLIATVFKVASAVAMAGTAIASIGGSMMALGTAISPLTALLAGVAGAMAVVEYKTKAGATLWGSYKDSVVKLYDTVMTNLRPILAEVQKVMTGITDAVRSGDLVLAFNIALTAVKVAWAEGMLWLSERTSGVFSGILKNLAGGNWKAAADGAVGMIKSAFLELKLVFNNIWDGLVIGLDTAITGLMPLLDKVKIFALDVMMWIKINVLSPLVRAFDKLASYDPTGNMQKVASAGYDAVRSFGDMVSKQQEEMGDPAKQAEKQAQRQQGLEDRVSARQLANAEQRKAIEAEIAALQKRGITEGTQSQQQTSTDIDNLKKQLDELNAQAAKQKEEAKIDEPKAMDKIGATSTAVTSSAYAFGQFGGGPSPEDEAKKQRQEQLKTANEELKLARQAHKEQVAMNKLLQKLVGDSSITLDMAGA